MGRRQREQRFAQILDLVPERALILAPRGRDAALAQAMLAEAGLAGEIVGSLEALVAKLPDEAGLAIVAEEALKAGDLAPLAARLAAQPEWSDFPFILLTERGGAERNPAASHHIALLGNVTFVERPFHPTTLVSLARAALRGRRKQYDARTRLEVLDQSEQRFRAAIHAVQGVLWTNSADGQMVGEQASWAGLTGQSRDEYQGYGWSNAVHPDDAQPTVDAWNDAVARRDLFVFEHRVRRHDGAWRTFSIRAIPTFASDGTLREWVGVHTDVTEKRIAEAELRDLNANLAERVRAAVAQRNVLADIVETTDVMIQVLDTNLCWIAINRAAADETERIIGIRPEIGVSMVASLNAVPEQRDTALVLWHRALGGERFTTVANFGDPARAQNRYELNFSPLNDAEGTQIGAFLLANNIEQRLADAERLAETEDALRQSQKMEAIGQLTGGVAHDFNNLLTVIRGSAEVLRRPDLAPEKQGRFVDAIFEAANRAAKLTQQLLAFSRKQTLKAEVFDVCVRVTETVDMIQSLVGSRIAMDVDCQPDIYVNADIAQFETALVNLCVNARDAMHGEGTLKLRAFGHGDRVCVTVEDNGDGIPPELLPRLFEPFFTTKAVGQGTGLGLSQVYGFTRQSNGDIEVTSTPGIGTRFTLWLPVTDALLAGKDEASSQSTGRSRHVLVVEDNVEVRAFAAGLLEELGHAVTTAASGDEALAKLDDDVTIDVVFSDVNMSGMSGLDLAAHVRKTWPHIDVVLASGYSDALATTEADKFVLLSKPYSSEQLAAVL